MKELLKIAAGLGFYGLIGFIYTGSVRRRIADEINKQGGKVLDIGSTGANTRIRALLPEIKGSKCDLVAKPELGIKHCDLRARLPFNDKSFDVVFISHTLEHVEPKEVISALKEMERVGNKVVIVLPAWWILEFWLIPEHRSQIYKTETGLHVRSHPFWSRTKEEYFVNLDKNIFRVEA